MDRMPSPAAEDDLRTAKQAKVDLIDLVHRDSRDVEADHRVQFPASSEQHGKQHGEQASSKPRAARRPSLGMGRSASEMLHHPFSYIQRRRSRRRRVTDSVLAGIRRHYAKVVDILSYVGLGLVLYAAMYLLIGKPMLPYGRGWSVFLLWVCAHIGGFLAAQVGLPPLLGMLIVGIILVNIPQDPIRGLPASWSTKIRTGGLATILMRAGLKIDKNAFKRAGRVVLSLALVPVICEAVVDGFCFYWLYAMPVALSLTGGFIMAAISPTVMVTGMLELQRRGYGQDKIIPSIEMAAAGLDSIAAIVGFAVCSGIAIPSGNLVYSILSGPLQVLYGLIAATGGALVCSCTKVWNNAIKRVVAVFITGLALMWLGLQFKYLGASSVACLSLTILTSLLWEKGFPPFLCKGPGRQQGYAKDADSKLAIVWVILVQPLLFGAIGAEINFHNIPGSVIVKTIIILALGMCATRLPTAFAVLQLSSFTMKERLFVALTWLPKATVQGALGSLPLLLIQSRETKAADYNEQVEHGNIILHSTAFSIIIAAPIGLLVIALLGPVWLSKDKLPDQVGPASVESSRSDSSDLGSDTDSTGHNTAHPQAAGGQNGLVTAFSNRPSRKQARGRRKRTVGLPDGQSNSAESGLGAGTGLGDVPVKRGAKQAADPLEPVLERTPQ